MKKSVFILLLITAALHSQEEKYERIMALKTAYFTEKLALTPSEAEKFWPIYNSFEIKFKDLRRRRNIEINKKLSKGAESLQDWEANNLIDNYLLIEFSNVDLEKQKVAALRDVISPQKIIGLKKAEDDFRQELLKKYREGKRKNNSSGGKEKR